MFHNIILLCFHTPNVTSAFPRAAEALQQRPNFSPLFYCDLMERQQRDRCSQDRLVGHPATINLPFHQVWPPPVRVRPVLRLDHHWRSCWGVGASRSPGAATGKAGVQGRSPWQGRGRGAQPLAGQGYGGAATGRAGVRGRSPWQGRGLSPWHGRGPGAQPLAGQGSEGAAPGRAGVHGRSLWKFVKFLSACGHL